MCQIKNVLPSFDRFSVIYSSRIAKISLTFSRIFIPRVKNVIVVAIDFAVALPGGGDALFTQWAGDLSFSAVCHLFRKNRRRKIEVLQEE